MTFAEFIRQKGAKSIAERLSERTPVEWATVRMWASRNNISRQVWPDLLLAYPELGMSDLLAMEQHSKQS